MSGVCPINPYTETCSICLNPLIQKKWQGKGNITAVLHNSSSHPHGYHEKCIRTWAATNNNKNSLCVVCFGDISDVAFYKGGRRGVKQVNREPIMVYQQIPQEMVQQREPMSDKKFAIGLIAFLCFAAFAKNFSYWNAGYLSS